MATSTLTITGMEDLKDMLEEMPGKVQRRMQNKGLVKAAAKMRTHLRRRARAMGGTGTLARSIGRMKRNKKAPGQLRIGLTTNYYYKTLELGGFTRRGKLYTEGLAPFFENTVELHSTEIAQMIVDETIKALQKEGAK